MSGPSGTGVGNDETSAFDPSRLRYVNLAELARLIDPDGVWEAFQVTLTLDVLDEAEAQPLIERLEEAGFQGPDWITRRYPSQDVRTRTLFGLNGQVTFVIAPERRAS